MVFDPAHLLYSLIIINYKNIGNHLGTIQVSTVILFFWNTIEYQTFFEDK